MSAQGKDLDTVYSLQKPAFSVPYKDLQVWQLLPFSLKYFFKLKYNYVIPSPPIFPLTLPMYSPCSLSNLWLFL